MKDVFVHNSIMKHVFVEYAIKTRGGKSIDKRAKNDRFVSRATLNQSNLSSHLSLHETSIVLGKVRKVPLNLL